ncbi:MAG: TonB-dependent receptor [Bacteroidota bacterium]
MKYFLPPIFFVLLTVNIFAQQKKSLQQKKDLPKYEITGKVIDKSTKQALEFATIIFKPLKGKRVFGGLTDKDGKFNIEVPKDTYNINIEFMSFKTRALANQKIESNRNLGILPLEEDAQALGEVEIIAERSTVEIRLDKKIYNVGKDMTVKGGTASDVLDNVPSVTVDAEGVVSLRGNENVKILVNGKPSSIVGLNDTEALKQFPADMIKKVEVITSPSARYEAEGTAGILNIILRKGKALGFNGSATVNAGVPTASGVSANLNYREEKYNLFNNTGFSYSDTPGDAEFNTEYYNPNARNPFMDEIRDYDRERSNFNTNFGIEYYLSENSSITGSILYRRSKRNTLSENLNTFSDSNHNEREAYYRNSDNERDFTNWQYSLIYDKEFKKDGHKLTVDFQYQNDDSDNLNYISEEEIINHPIENSDEKEITFETEKEYLLKGDYVLPIGEDQQFEAGFRSSIKDESTDYTVLEEENDDLIINDDLSNIFNYDEKIHALYTQYGNRFGKVSALFGLRMEYTNIDVEIEGEDLDAHKNYTDFFPTLHLSYEIDDDHNITLGYNRRIRRPRSRFINPFPSRSSESNIFQGNPYIDPSISNGFDLGYYKRWEKVTFNTSVYYNHATDIFQFISEDTGETTGDGIPIIRRTPINLSSNDRIGYEFSLNYTPVRKWRMNASFNLYNSITEGEYNGVNYDSESLGWFTRFSSKVVLPAKIDWQTTMMYRGPFESAQSKRDGMFMANMAFSKDILKGNGTISLNVNDLFNTRKHQRETFTEDFYQESEFQWRKRQFRLAFTYRFKQKKKRQRQDGFDNGGDEEIL